MRKSNFSRDEFNIIFTSKTQKKQLLVNLIIWLMGFGPGMVIANKPVLVGKTIPVLWLWWICWFVAWCFATYVLFYVVDKDLSEN